MKAAARCRDIRLPIRCRWTPRISANLIPKWSGSRSGRRSKERRPPHPNPFGFRALGISALGDSVTPVGCDRKPLTQSLVGSLDVRAVDQAAWLSRTIGQASSHRLTGVPVHPMFALPKVMWFRDNRPDIYERAWNFVGWQDLLHLYLGLDPAMDYSLGCRTMAVDVNTRDWAYGILDRTGISVGKFSPFTRHGPWWDRSTKRTLLLCWDCRLGSRWSPVGSIRPAWDSAGRGDATGNRGSVVWDRPVRDPDLGRGVRADQLLSGNYGYGLHVVDDVHITMVHVVASGAAIRWCRHNLSWDGARSADSVVPDIDTIMRELPNRPARVFVLPYFAGAGTPSFDPEQRAVIHGITLDTDKHWRR